MYTILEFSSKLKSHELTKQVSNANSQISMILGRPFLATSNALINCRSGVLKLSFGNMTLEHNIFNTCSKLGMKRICLKLT